MKRATMLSVSFLFCVSLTWGGCGGDDSAGCTEGLQRCGSSIEVETCVSGSWTMTDVCGSPETCDNGVCGGCQPDCTGRVCGDDGCGGSCGDCTAPQTCTLAGQCEDPPEDCGNGVCDPGEDCVNCPDDCQCVTCDPSTVQGLMQCVDHSRFVADLTYVAGERTPGSTHWQQVQDYCAAELAAAGLTVTLQSYGSGVNVVGTLTGTTAPDESVVLIAHYDHVPNCSGADDNASGVAAVIEAARVLAQTSFARTLKVVCDDEEESGLIGSFEYAREANNAGERFAAVFAVDAIAYTDDTPGSQIIPLEFQTLFPALYAEAQANQFRGNFIYVGYDDTATEGAASFETLFEGLGRLAGMAMWTGDAKFQGANLRADHVNFWAYAYPAMLINDTSPLRNPHYHCASGDDDIASLDLDFGADVTRAVVGAAATVLNSSTPVPARPTPITCNQLCSAAASMSPTELQCIADILDAMDLPVSTTPQCATINTVSDCTACTGALGLLDGDCSILNYWCAP